MRCVLARPGNETLGARLAGATGARVATLHMRQFPDGELYLRVEGEVRGCEVILACTLDRPNDKLLALYHLAATVRELGARRVLLAAPYLAYMRQDVAFHPGEAVTARHNAAFLSGFLDGLVTVDPHLHRIHALSDVFHVPALAVSAAPMIAAFVRDHVPNALVVGPDSESEQWAAQVARDAGCPHVVLSKQRRGDRDVRVEVPDVSAFRDRTPVLIDDIVSTGRTLVEAAQGLRRAGLRVPTCVGVHALFSSGAWEALRAEGLRVVTCDTIVHPSNGIEVWRAVADALSGI